MWQLLKFTTGRKGKEKHMSEKLSSTALRFVLSKIGNIAFRLTLYFWNYEQNQLTCQHSVFKYYAQQTGSCSHLHCHLMTK